nr:hypothetical protein [Tanacetum cinerariifolium]
MSDSEDSTVTYTEVSSPFEDMSDIGSPGVVVYRYDRQPMHPPSPDYVPGPKHPPSLDYVPSPEHPPSPDFVSKLVYPEFMPPKDDVLLAKEHPLPAAVSPTVDSPRYITESNPKKDPEEDDEDPEAYPADYPTDRDDDEDPEEDPADYPTDKEEEEKENE